LSDSESQPPLRRIRSFVRREGRLTAGQSRALAQEWPKYGIDTPVENLDLAQLFGRDAPRVVEIGFGMGESLAQMAQAQPDTDFLGIEVHRPGVGHLLGRAAEAGSTNVRVAVCDAVDFLQQALAPESVDAVHIFFPDPWHKRKHHKRRLIQAEFVRTICARLRPGGYLHVATDWKDYARKVLAVLEAEPALVNTSESGDYVPRPDYRPETKFERRGVNLGHGVWDLVFSRR
jgi:tRNA (guanine-N7-)-methyltransferase